MRAGKKAAEKEAERFRRDNGLKGYDYLNRPVLIRKAKARIFYQTGNKYAIYVRPARGGTWKDIWVDG